MENLERLKSITEDLAECFEGHGIPNLDYVDNKVKELQEVVKLLLPVVSQQRELLTAFLEYGKQRHYTPLTSEQIEALVNDFQGSL